MLSPEKIIYMAGIIDGEGSIHIELQAPNRTCRKTDYYSIRLVVINTSKSLMDWIQINFHGKVFLRKKIINRKQCYQWSIFSHNAAEILKACLPYMIIKKKQAEILLEFMETKPKDEWNVSTEVQFNRRRLYNLMKEVNKSGDYTL